jgi:transposase-like protein
MSRHPELQNTEGVDLVNLLLEHGLADGIIAVLTTTINNALLAERRAFINADPYQRKGDERNGYANGFKDRDFGTSVGKLNLRMPQVRQADRPFRSTLLKNASRCDEALKLAAAEIFLLGVSTRKVSKILETICDFEISTTEVARATKELDEELQKWRERPLDKIASLYIDATYVKVRDNGSVRSAALLIAIGIRESDNKRMILGVSCAISEAEVHWREFLQELKNRGMGIPKLVTSDAHEGLKAALKTTLGCPWQRCQFHLQQNAQAYVTKLEQRPIIAAEIRRIFDAKDRANANYELAQLVKQYEKTAPKLSIWLEENVPESLTVFDFPEAHRKRLRTSNIMENLNRQIKRRTDQISLFANTQSVLRVVCAITRNISEEWETSRAYLPPIPKETLTKPTNS